MNKEDIFIVFLLVFNIAIGVVLGALIVFDLKIRIEEYSKLHPNEPITIEPPPFNYFVACQMVALTLFILAKIIEKRW